MKKLVLIALTAFVVAGYTFAHAALVDRGNGLIYDTDLNITWYDYSYHGPAGTLATVSQAYNWVGNLSITVNGVTFSDWRLPQALPVDGSLPYNLTSSNNGSTDVGYNISAPGSAYPGSKGSEIAYLYYVELGNKAYYDINGNPQSGWGLLNVGPFQNLLTSSLYLLKDQYSGSSFYFALNDGYQGFSNDIVYSQYGTYNLMGLALAVHPGDIGAPVPIPPTIYLLGAGLVGLVGLKRKFSSK